LGLQEADDIPASEKTDESIHLDDGQLTDVMLSQLVQGV